MNHSWRLHPSSAKTTPLLHQTTYPSMNFHLSIWFCSFLLTPLLEWEWELRLWWLLLWLLWWWLSLWSWSSWAPNCCSRWNTRRQTPVSRPASEPTDGFLGYVSMSLYRLCIWRLEWLCMVVPIPCGFPEVWHWLQSQVPKWFRR